MKKYSLYRLFPIILIIMFFLGLFYAHKLRATKRNYSDFHCFYTAGKRIINQQDIYIIKDKEAAEFRYAPIFALFMSGFSLMKESDADSLWFIINFCLLIVSFLIFGRLIRCADLDYKSSFILYLLTILGAMRFILHNFDTGQANILMLSSILTGLYFIEIKKNEFIGGAILAFSVMVKYTPIIFLPYFIVRRKIKLSIIIVVSILAYLAIPYLFVGFKHNLYYLKNLIPFLTKSTILEPMTILDPKNQSLFSMVHRFFTKCVLYFHSPHMPFQSLGLDTLTKNSIFVWLSIILYAFILYDETGKNKSRIIDYAMLLICIALFNLNAWMHNYIFLSLAYFIIVYYLIKVGSRDWIVFSLLMLSYILNFITIPSILSKTIVYKLYFYSPFTISALVSFMVLLKIKFAKHNYLSPEE